MSATESTVVDCQNLDEAIDKYTTRLGYRLDMIMPADAPREALLSKKSEPPAVAGGLTHDVNEQEQTRRTHFVRLICENANLQPPATAGGFDWVTGRAGMEYRDLIPGRLGGKVIASHIRLTKGGVVPDYVHYHKVDFQMIYCKRGRIRVVYEDQGPPFWLETGDCVLQPPEIRHRVLECTAGAEVIEVSMPAEHETWVEHEIELPNVTVDSERTFNGQRFAHRKFSELRSVKAYHDEIRDFDLAFASDNFVNVQHISFADEAEVLETGGMAGVSQFYFILEGFVNVRCGQKVLDHDSSEDADYTMGDSFTIPPQTLTKIMCSGETEILAVAMNMAAIAV